MSLILPGSLLPLPQPSPSHLTLGPGTLSTASRDGKRDVLIANKMGVVGWGVKRRKGEEEGRVWVDERSKRYIPTSNDSVLGTVISRFSGGFRVDIGSSTMASLDALAFEGATKRSAPRFEIGTLIYARISLANKDMEPELTCVNPTTGKSDGFGEIKGGLVVEGLGLGLCRILLTPSSPFASSTLPFPFELTIGSNGRIHINADSIGRVVVVRRLLEALYEGVVGDGKISVTEWLQKEGEGV